jgi:hypothetical protein
MGLRRVYEDGRPPVGEEEPARREETQGHHQRFTVTPDGRAISLGIRWYSLLISYIYHIISVDILRFEQVRVVVPRDGGT